MASASSRASASVTPRLPLASGSLRGLSGPRGVRIAVAIIGPILLGLILWQLLIPRFYYTGSDSVSVYAPTVAVNQGEQLCVNDVDIPADTGVVQMTVFAAKRRVEAQLSVTAEGATTTSLARGITFPSAGDRGDLDASIPTRPSSPDSVPGTVCMTPMNARMQLGGVPGVAPGYPSPVTLNGATVPDRVSVWFLPPDGQKRSLISSLGAIFRRAALFRPGIVGSWTYPVLLFGVLPATWILAFFLLVRAAAGRELRVRGRRIRPALLIGLIAFLNAGCWALITPAFEAPDEPSHFAYVQYLAETGHMPAKAPDGQPEYSTEETLALGAMGTYSTVSSTEGLPPWQALNQLGWEQVRQRGPHPSDNGGGYTVAASIHDPPYYALAAIPYLAVSSQSIFSQLTFARLLSALLGAIVAICAFGVVRELFPRQPVAAVAAGLLVGFQPMFAFISGAVNNDNGVNAGAALSLYLLIRALRRGLSWRLGLALGATIAITPLLKETGYEIYPVAVVGVLCLLWRARDRLQADPRVQARPWAALLGAFAGVIVVWRLIEPHLLDAYATHGGLASSAAGGVSTTGSISQALHQPGRFLEYLWELFLPRLSFMTETFPHGWPFYQVYVIRGWGAFGWYTFEFPNVVYILIVVAMGVVGLLALRSAVTWWPVIRDRLPELSVILLFPVCVLVAVEAAYFTPTNARVVVAEQGRYIFPAIAALAVIAVGGTFGLGRRLQVPLATGLVVAMIGLSYASQLLGLQSFFT